MNHANSGFGITALTRAAFYGHAEVIKVLIANKADVNKAPTDGRTAIIVAAHKGHVEAVKVLAEAGADVTHLTAVCQ